jgi:hypothetical protein
MKRYTLGIFGLLVACADATTPVVADRVAMDLTPDLIAETDTPFLDVKKITDVAQFADAGLDATDGSVALDSMDVMNTMDAMDATDAMTAVPDVRVYADAPRCPFDVVRPPVPPPYKGFLRLINLARGVGSVRFVVRAQPMYRPAYLEAVVPEGTSTGHVEMLAVNYAIRVVAAGTSPAEVTVIDTLDGGVVPPGTHYACDDPAMDGALTPTRCAGVYFGGGCTLVLIGSAHRDGSGPSTLRLWNLADLQARSDTCDESTVRLINAYSEGPNLDVETDSSMPLAAGLEYRAPTASRRVSSGTLRITARVSGSSTVLGRYALPLNASHGHTLFLWGDAANTGAMGLDALVVDDIPLYLW